MEIDILSLFPGYFQGPFDESIVKQAKKKDLLRIDLHDIREFAEGRHRQVDDRPYGGGPGMVLMPGPVKKAIEKVRQPNSRVIHLSPQGQPLTAKLARKLAEEEHIVLLCGHYEGIDQRVLDKEVDEEISIGDYVLTNGCLPAIVLVDAVIRHVPGVLGHEKAAEEESFERGILDCPHYTRPECFEDMKVPEELLGGDHKRIADWRYRAALRKTEQMRPDLYVKVLLEERKATKRGKARESGVAEAGLHRVHLMVSHLKKSLAFYEGVLGLPLKEKGDDYALLDMGNIELMLMVGQSDEKKGLAPLFEVQFADEQRFRQMAKQVLGKAEIGYSPGKPGADAVSEMTLQVSDPDGHHWCLRCEKES